MKRYRLHRVVVITGMLFAFPFQDAPAQAGQIRYSWSGRIVPNGSDGLWQVGVSVERFFGLSKEDLR